MNSPDLQYLQYPLFTFTFASMIVEKYVLCLQTACDKVGKRMGISKPANLSDLAVMFAMKRSPANNYAGIYRYISARKAFTETTMKNSMTYLLDNDLARKDDRQYFLTPKGMEYLSAIRRYLLNIRL